MGPGDDTPSLDVAHLFKEHSAELLAHARRLLGSRSRGGEDAEDIVERVFSELLLRDAGDPIRNPRAYLHRAVRSRCSDLRESGPGQTTPVEPEDSANTNGPDVMDAALTRAELEALAPGLTAAEQLVLNETMLGDRTRADVAHDLGVTSQRVSQLVRRIAQKLRPNFEITGVPWRASHTEHEVNDGP